MLTLLVCRKKYGIKGLLDVCLDMYVDHDTNKDKTNSCMSIEVLIKSLKKSFIEHYKNDRDSDGLRYEKLCVTTLEKIQDFGAKKMRGLKVGGLTFFD